MNKTTTYLLSFQKIGLSAPTLRRLREHIPDVAELWQADAQQLEKIGPSQSFIHRFISRRASLSPETYAHQTERPGMTIVGLDEENYPGLLRETHNPPLVIFVRGEPAVLHQRCLTVVGTRQMTRYGAAATTMIIQPLARHKITIVSGLAFGIDAAAHSAALDHSLPTVAVLGSSVDLITPVANLQLGQRIIQNGGAIISEYPPGTTAQKHHFPQRNRILAGLSKATLVIEAGLTSGALITAKFALEEGRDVFAVPGPITAASSAGTNNLLRHGATPASSADDLSASLGLDIAPIVDENMRIDVPTETEATLLSLLRQTRHVDELVAMSRLEASIVSATLSILELKGSVRHLGGMHYLRTL